MATSATKNMPKICTDFFCEKCNYRCSKKSLWTQHISTLKHNRQQKCIFSNEKYAPTKFTCDICNKVYHDRSGLWRHKKKCNETEKKHVSTKDISNIEDVGDLESLNKTDLIKMMGEALNQMKKQSDVISELVPKVGNNNNNTQFNLNIFLNEDCKDAIDWSDFVKSIEFEVNDLKALKDSNITTSISNAICNKMNELGVYKRPIHCYDPKRKKLCIKNNKDWEKEEEKVDELLEKGGRGLQHKYITLVEEWENEHPNWTDDEKQVEEYMKLQQKIYEDVDKKKSKINLVKEVNIPKN